MSPAFDKGVTAKNLLDFTRRRRIQAQKLHIMARISFMDRNDVRSVIIEGGQPFFLLFFWPVALRWRDIIISFGRALLERAGRIH